MRKTVARSIEYYEMRVVAIAKSKIGDTAEAVGETLTLLSAARASI
jgi:hypothetical protein